MLRYSVHHAGDYASDVTELHFGILAPSGAPIGFAGSARSATEIITQWQPPLEDTRNGRILGYIIRYKLYGYNDSPWTYQNITNEVTASGLCLYLFSLEKQYQFYLC